MNVREPQPTLERIEPETMHAPQAGGAQQAGADPHAQALAPRVSVVVPTWRRPDLLGRCLGALVAQTLPPEQYEIVVCDDGPDDSTRALVANFADAHAARGLHIDYLPISVTQGPAAARNAGWRRARAPIVAFTDDDTIPDARWLEAGLAALADGVMAASGAIVVPLGRAPTDYEADASGLAHAEFATANAFVRRAALAAVGGFDERFTAAWREDSDLQFSLMRMGARIVRAENAIVVHPVRPARWGVSLSQQKKSCFEALLYAKHRDLYKTRIARTAPWRYYAIVLAAMGAVASAIGGAYGIAAGAGAVWAALSAHFFAQRMRARSRHWKHVAEMAVTSAVIPFLSIYWRIRGAIRYRIWFL